MTPFITPAGWFEFPVNDGERRWRNLNGEHVTVEEFEGAGWAVVDGTTNISVLLPGLTEALAFAKSLMEFLSGEEKREASVPVSRLRELMRFGVLENYAAMRQILSEAEGK